MGDIVLGRVVGRFLRLEQGFPGAGADPVQVPVPSMRVAFKPDLDPARLKELAGVTPVSVWLQQFVCRTDEEGYLVNGQGERWQALPASVDTTLGYSEWAWRCTVTLAGGDTVSFRFLLGEYTNPGTEVDLTTVVEVPAAPGLELAAWESAVLRVQGVRDLVVAAGQAAVADIDAAAGGVEDRAVAAATEAATAAAASYTVQAGNSATAAASSATQAAGSASTAAGHVVTAQAAATEAATAAGDADASADRAEAAADGVDMGAINARLNNMDASIAGKADLVSGRVPQAQATWPASSAATADALVLRDTDGAASVGAPTSADHATTKGYVDTRTVNIAPVTLTPIAGYTAADFTVRVVNSLVYIEGTITGTFASGYTVVTANGAIPVALRPKRSVPGGGYSSGAYPATGIATSEGIVQVAHMSGSNRAWASFTIIYPYAP